MRERCEVCESFRPDTELPGDRNTVVVPFDARAVRLCRGHARIAERSGATSFEQLRELYGSGRRSFVPRRAPVAAPETDDRRGSAGRRATDRRDRPL
jgi:hypothetical protein